MQKIVLIVVVIVLGLLAFNYFTTGEFSLMPAGGSSDDGRELNSLRGEFRSAAREFRQAGRSAEHTGLAIVILLIVPGILRLRRLRS